MLSREQFAEVKDIETAVNPLDLFNLSRRMADRPPDPETPYDDLGIYFKYGKRQYRVEKVGTSVKIEGLILPPAADIHAPLADKLRNVESMRPITILISGVITSLGERISPHDERLSKLTHDLSFPTMMKAKTYQTNAAKIVKSGK